MAARFRAVVVVGLLALAVAACGTPSASETTTTTTTTLPTPIGLAGSSSNGPYGSFGSIYRVPVEPVAEDALVPPSPPSGVSPAPDSVRIGFRQFGSGPDLLLIMGQHGTMTWWDPALLSALAGHFTVTIFDLPGVGYSAPAHGTPSVTSFSDLSAGLIDALGLKTPVVLGWGLGGAVALALIERHPGLCSGLVLADAAIGPEASTPAARKAAALLASPDSTMDELASALFPSSEAKARVAFLEHLAEVPPDDIVAKSASLETALVASLGSGHALLESAATVRVPVLVISGSADPLYPESDARALAKAFHGAKRLVVEGGGYGAIFSDEDAVVTAMTDLVH